MSDNEQENQVGLVINTDASTKIAGFTYQFQRALYRLMSATQTSTLIGIETFDDVAELKLHDDGSVEVTLEQDKHSVQEGGHPYQDSSKNLWHTMRVWLSQIKELKAKHSKVTFFLATNKKVPDSAFVRQLSKASTQLDFIDCIKVIRNLVEEVKGAAKDDLAIVASHDDADITYVLENLVLFDQHDEGSGISLRQTTIQLFQLHTNLLNDANSIYQSLIGELVDTCQTRWLLREPAWFTPQKFKDRLSEEVKRRSLDKYLDKDMLSTGFKEYVKSDSRDHLFLKQLSRIDVPAVHINDELDNYWAFYLERARLIDEGVVFPEDWESREFELHKRWKGYLRNITLANLGVPEQNSEKFGRELFAKTVDPEYRAKLGSHATNNPYFTQGHYHQLANNPLNPYFVYWHDSFLSSDNNEKEN